MFTGGKKEMNILELSKKYPELKKILDSVCVVDVGNTFVKTDDFVAVPSTVVEVQKFDDVTDSTASKVEWNGKKYIVASRKGAMNMEPDKYKTDGYKLSLLNAIALNFENKSKIETRLGLGLPAKFYVDHHVELRNEIKALDKQTITIDGEPKEIKILDVVVFKQGGTLSVDATEKYKYPLMILDFGGGTLDISYWEEQAAKRKGQKKKLVLSDSRSFTEFGFELVMSEFATKCNAMPGGDGKYTSFDVIQFLEDNEIPFGDAELLQKMKDEAFAPYCNLVTSKVTTELRPNSCKDIRVMGGPAVQLLSYLEGLSDKVKPQLMDEEDSQCLNARLFAEKYKELLAADFLEGIAGSATTEAAATTTKKD
jgi:plasmid segregation protein ParM